MEDMHSLMICKEPKIPLQYPNNKGPEYLITV